MLKVGQVEGKQKILSNNFPINNINKIAKVNFSGITFTPAKVTSSRWGVFSQGILCFC